MKESVIPDDDLARALVVADADAADVRHVALAGNVYTILVSGVQTAGRYCLIDMRILDGGGPVPHRHDFEEMFTLLDGELEVTFRGDMRTVRAPATINIPANAPHSFKNVSGKTAHMLCMCTPAGQDDFFLAVGDPVDSRDSSPPRLSDDEQNERRQRAAGLAAKYRTEFLR